MFRIIVRGIPHLAVRLGVQDPNNVLVAAGLDRWLVTKCNNKLSHKQLTC